MTMIHTKRRARAGTRMTMIDGHHLHDTNSAKPQPPQRPADPDVWSERHVESFNYSKRNQSVHPCLAAGGFSMHLFVAFGAQSDQILFDIASRLAAEFEMVHLQVLHAAAILAAPAVAL